MTTDWKEITNPEELFRLKREGWEVQIQSDAGNDKYCPFKEWDGRNWNIGYLFRARPPQPKMKKERMLAYLLSGQLVWFQDDIGCPQGNRVWIRVPAQDIEIEVPDEQ